MTTLQPLLPLQRPPMMPGSAKGFPHNSLKQGPSKGEGHANHDGQKDTRQAKPNNNDAGHAIFFKEAFEDLSRRNIGAANSQGKNGKNAKCDEKRPKIRNQSVSSFARSRNCIQQAHKVFDLFHFFKAARNSKAAW